MTDARYPERWLHDRRITRLPDRAHRAYVVTLAYCVANRTDGAVALADLDDLPGYVREEAPALTRAGLWVALEDGTGFQVADYLDTQSSRAELEAADNARMVAREKKARQRAGLKPAAPDPEAASAAVPGDVPGDHTGQDRTGQARQGQALSPSAPKADSGWPEVAVPGLRALPDPRTTSDCHGCGFEHGHMTGCRYAS